MKKAGAALLIVVILVAAGAYLLYSRVTTPFRAYTSDEQFVSVPPGLGTTSIGKRLIDAGVVRDEITFRAALWLSGDARRLQAGDYRFDRPMTPLEVVDKIARGDVDVQTFTVPEGLTITEMAELFATNGLGTAASFVTAARNAALIQDLDPAAKDLEGYLFPETYRLPRGSGAEALVKLMVTQFRSVVTEQLRADASTHGLSVRQLVTLASMVEKETSRPDERKIVAAVYLNRLRDGMPMQCDPTVIYALARAGRYTGNLRRDDLMFDSLYNTYRYPGLPPGPIAAPGRASLEASARPDSVDYLYFVSRNDGSHVFARTLTEHNRNVQTYQVEFFRAGRAGK
jgi:UPF0755 protein